MVYFWHFVSSLLSFLHSLPLALSCSLSQSSFTLTLSISSKPLSGFRFIRSFLCAITSHDWHGRQSVESREVRKMKSETDPLFSSNNSGSLFQGPADDHSRTFPSLPIDLQRLTLQFLPESWIFRHCAFNKSLLSNFLDSKRSLSFLFDQSVVRFARLLYRLKSKSFPSSFRLSLSGGLLLSSSSSGELCCVSSPVPSAAWRLAPRVPPISHNPPSSATELEHRNREIFSRFPLFNITHVTIGALSSSEIELLPLLFPVIKVLTIAAIRTDFDWALLGRFIRLEHLLFSFSEHPLLFRQLPPCVLLTQQRLPSPSRLSHQQQRQSSSPSNCFSSSSSSSTTVSQLVDPLSILTLKLDQIIPQNSVALQSIVIHSPKSQLINVALAASNLSRLKSIQSLSFTTSAKSSDSAQLGVVLSSQSFPLQHLSLNFDYNLLYPPVFSPESLHALNAASWAPQLRSLRLCGRYHLSVQVPINLFGGFRSLETLELAHTHTWVLDAIPSLSSKHLTSLIIRDHLDVLSTTTVDLVFSAAHLSSLSHLQLCCANNSKLIAPFLVASIGTRMSNLHSLHLQLPRVCDSFSDDKVLDQELCQMMTQLDSLSSLSLKIALRSNSFVSQVPSTLCSLFLSNPYMEDEAAQHISRLVRLETLQLVECLKISSLKHITSACSLIHSLDLSRNFNSLKNRELQCITKLSRLETLNLGYCYGVKAKLLNCLSTLPHLRQLNLLGCRPSNFLDTLRSAFSLRDLTLTINNSPLDVEELQRHLQQLQVSIFRVKSKLPAIVLPPKL